VGKIQCGRTRGERKNEGKKSPQSGIVIFGAKKGVFWDKWIQNKRFSVIIQHKIYFTRD
jgi:hypothetical protein